MDWIPIYARPYTKDEWERLIRDTDDPTIEDDIPCKYDGRLLPANGEDVLVTTRRGYVTTDVFCVRDDGICFFLGYRAGEVVAWMPFPEPYKKEDKE